MTSSFGNLVGTERDALPNIANTNYTNTEPDLTDSVNAQIDANIQDTREFYDEMAKIQKLIAETPMKNLEALADFSRSATEAMGVYRKKQEAQALVDESLAFLDNNALDQIRTAEGKFNLENAKFDNELLKENT